MDIKIYVDVLSALEQLSEYHQELGRAFYDLEEIASGIVTTSNTMRSGTRSMLMYFIVKPSKRMKVPPRDRILGAISIMSRSNEKSSSYAHVECDG